MDILTLALRVPKPTLRLFSILERVLVGRRWLLRGALLGLSGCVVFRACLGLLTWRRREGVASRLVREYDGHDASFQRELEEVRGGEDPAPEDDGGDRAQVAVAPIVRWARGRKRGLAYGLAEEAYYQFGFRAKSEANMLITRKFMRDLLKEHKDLRAKDAAELIDRGLELSFLPTRQLKAMNVISETYVFSDRARLGPQSWIGWLLSRFTPDQRR